MADTRAASRAARLLVYGAGLAQGLALVSFPAASSILTSPTGYDLSTAQYGLMFLPQVVLAITAGTAILWPPTSSTRVSLRCF